MYLGWFLRVDDSNKLNHTPTIKGTNPCRRRLFCNSPVNCINYSHTTQGCINFPTQGWENKQLATIFLILYHYFLFFSGSVSRALHINVFIKHTATLKSALRKKYWLWAHCKTSDEQPAASDRFSAFTQRLLFAQLLSGPWCGCPWQRHASISGESFSQIRLR